MFLRVAGLGLLLVGATAATVLHRRYAKHLPVQVVLLLLALAGALMGTGAALVRDFALLPTSVFAATVVPIVALVTAARAARKHGR